MVFTAFNVTFDRAICFTVLHNDTLPFFYTNHQKADRGSAADFVFSQVLYILKAILQILYL